MGKRLSIIFLAAIMAAALMPSAAFAVDPAMPFAGGGQGLRAILTLLRTKSNFERWLLR